MNRVNTFFAKTWKQTCEIAEKVKKETCRIAETVKDETCRIANEVRNWMHENAQWVNQRRRTIFKYLIAGTIGACVLPAILCLIGLSPIGPVAGGLFASHMGAAVASGSCMAWLQSLAMGG